MKLVWSPKFTRATKKLARRRPGLIKDLETALTQLEEDPCHPTLRTHKLSGDFEGCWACSAGYDSALSSNLFARRKQQEQRFICSTSARTTRFTDTHGRQTDRELMHVVDSLAEKTTEWEAAATKLTELDAPEASTVAAP